VRLRLTVSWRARPHTKPSHPFPKYGRKFVQGTRRHKNKEIGNDPSAARPTRHNRLDAILPPPTAPSRQCCRCGEQKISPTPTALLKTYQQQEEMRQDADRLTACRGDANSASKDQLASVPDRRQPDACPALPFEVHVRPQRPPTRCAKNMPPCPSPSWIKSAINVSQQW